MVEYLARVIECMGLYINCLPFVHWARYPHMKEYLAQSVVKES